MGSSSVNVDELEDRIRTNVLTKGRRIDQYFVDFDTLRSGYVTRTQFFRVLWQNLQMGFTEDEEAVLVRRYDVKDDGKINWRQFCLTTLPKFNSGNVRDDPTCQRVEAKELLGTTRTLQPQGPEVEVYMEKLLRRMQHSFRQSGLNLRVACMDNDQPRLGLVTESQFYRFCPRPADVGEEDLAKLVDKYRVPDRPGFINYLNLANDLDALDDVMRAEEAPSVPRAKESEDYIPRHMPGDTSLQEILDHLRVTVYKFGIRTMDFFSDYDKRRTGRIEEGQFVKALVLAVGKETHLSPGDIQKVVEFYRVEGNCINYREFCDLLDNAFSDPELIRNPTQDIVRPGRGALGRSLSILSEREEDRASEVLDRLRREVEEKRILLYPVFKDFDKATTYSRLISRDQFERALRTVGLLVPYTDFVLLCGKFEDPTTGEINYPGFVQTVDKQFINYKQDTVKEYDKCGEAPAECDPRPDELVDFDHLIARLRHVILVNRIRVSEYFRDFDPLRIGTVSITLFERCLSRMGFDSIGYHRLSRAQFNALVDFYRDPQNVDKIMYKKFEKDVNIVFGISHLEKTPSVEVPPSETFVCDRPGTMDWRFASEDQREFTDSVISRISTIIRHRGIDIRSFYKGFDKLNLRCVSRDLFRRALGTAGLECSEADMSALEAKYSNDTGVDYVTFTKEVDPVEDPPLAYLERVKTLHKINEREPLTELRAERDLESVLNKIKAKVYKERLRVIEFMRDYDRYNTGRILKTHFRRALDLCLLDLAESELSQLEDHFQSAADIDCVEYRQFSDEIESIFYLKSLITCPTTEVERFFLKEKVGENEVIPGNEKFLKCCLERLAKRVRENRIQLFPLFQDFDRLNKGSITKNQFRRALSEMGLAELAPAETEWVALWDKFRVKVGGIEEVDYIAFCDVVHGLGGYSFRLS